MNALIIVDVQYDFLPGGGEYQPNWTGALGVPGGWEIIKPLFKLDQDRQRYDYDMVIASYDWHPKNHCSFIENGGQWPTHCVQDTMGAQLEQTVMDIADFYVEKGGNPEREAYSAFDGFVYGPELNYADKKNPLLADFLRDSGIESVDVCGLALDYCVKATALSAAGEGFYTSVFLDLTRPVEYLTGARAIESMVAHRVDIETSIYT